DDGVDPRQDRAGNEESAESIFDFNLPAVDQLHAPTRCSAVELSLPAVAVAPGRRGRLDRPDPDFVAHDFSVHETRQRIHAAAERGDFALHADRGARNVNYRSDEDPSNT